MKSTVVNMVRPNTKNISRNNVYISQNVDPLRPAFQQTLLNAQIWPSLTISPSKVFCGHNFFFFFIFLVRRYTNIASERPPMAHIPIQCPHTNTWINTHTHKNTILQTFQPVFLPTEGKTPANEITVLCDCPPFNFRITWQFSPNWYQRYKTGGHNNMAADTKTCDVKVTLATLKLGP